MENEGGSSEVSETTTTVVPFKKRLGSGDIIAAVDWKTIEVDVPEWGGSVLLKSLSAEEALGFADELKKDPTFAPVRLLVKSLVDERGVALFTLDDLDKLKKKSISVINRLQDEALKLNGLGQNAAAAAEAAKKV